VEVRRQVTGCNGGTGSLLFMAPIGFYVMSLDRHVETPMGHAKRLSVVASLNTRPVPARG